ncbi:type II toxin-antitoxin system VapC family toxin [Paludisphaera rhizosphaerae]|uniref:type II toxin-antitoxin system VapC family toxin n=1 Tax=Paludisphaera rhizosphaerae TaxID=2711216 RepID=UPI0013EB96A6|nr:type II toxin-antitoxin system VapC family toxin [Paludisphaera rhizosphaerae]
MPHYFFDTSALVKHYHAEAGSLEVSKIVDDPKSINSIARLTLAEMVSVFARKVRTGEIRDPDFDLLKLRFFADVAHRLIVPVRILNGHFEAAGSLISKHGRTRQLHTLDALQLAVALSIQFPSPVDHFVSADQRLLEIAARQGLSCINPETI